MASFVNDAQKAVADKVKLPPGYTLRWGGDFENLQSASLRLAIITPVILLVIWLLLFTSLNSNQLAALIFLAVPIAASGGIMALALRGMPFSISGGVGFIALFGVAVLNGLVWVSSAEQLRESGMTPQDAAREAAADSDSTQVLMTALVASLGFLPMALSTTAGAEIQRPLASVVIGGLVTSTLLTALVVPAIYPWFALTAYVGIGSNPNALRAGPGAEARTFDCYRQAESVVARWARTKFPTRSCSSRTERFFGYWPELSLACAGTFSLTAAASVVHARQAQTDLPTRSCSYRTRSFF